MRFGLAALLLLATPAAIGAQVPDPLRQTTDPADRAVMADAMSAISAAPPDMARLDAVLARLPRPTPLRGMVQTVRALALSASSDPGPAVATIEEALRLLPDDPRPKLVASHIFTFAGSPQRAADLWLLASRQAPDIARGSDRYSMMALLGRLDDLRDGDRADRLRARLGEVGFSSGLAPERSNAALGRTRDAARAGRMADALTHVTGVADPEDLLTLQIDRRYDALWPRIEEWAGADLAAQSRRYLDELRGDWTAADSFATAAPYARRLAALDAHDAVVALFLPMFDRVRPGAWQDEAEFLAPVVARSLARLQRPADATALLARVRAAMPANYRANLLNIDAAQITLASTATNWREVLDRADRFLAQARALGEEVNRSALVNVESLRACALSRLGDAARAEPVAARVALAEAQLPGPAYEMHLCRGDVASARALVLARLADAGTRDWALRVVQPERRAPVTPYGRLVAPVAQAVRADPAIVAAVGRVGRILPRPVLTGVPAGFDPFRVTPVRAASGQETI